MLLLKVRSWVSPGLNRTGPELCAREKLTGADNVVSAASDLKPFGWGFRCRSGDLVEKGYLWLVINAQTTFPNKKLRNSGR